MSRDALRKRIDELRLAITNQNYWLEIHKERTREDRRAILQFRREIRDLKRQARAA